MPTGSVSITGGAGYIGAAVVGRLLARGSSVSVLDRLDYGGDSLLGFRSFPGFRQVVADVASDPLDEAMAGCEAAIHLAALVGFPACDRAGRDETFRVNLTGTQRAYEAARRCGVRRFVFASSYSNYGAAPDGTRLTEASPLNPRSSYAESKVSAESWLLAREGEPAVTCLRLATVFGISPRTRFDLMVNQFALQAHLGEPIRVYQGDFQRAFVHVGDVARAFELVIDGPVERVAGQVFNVGDDALNSSKLDLLRLVGQRWPGLVVESSDASFAGDTRSLHVSFDKIRERLDFRASVSLTEGLDELQAALRQGLHYEPSGSRHRNHPPLLQ